MKASMHDTAASFASLPPEALRVCLDALLHDVGALALLIDRDGRILAANAASEQFCEPEYRPLAGRTFRDLVEPAVADMKVACIRRALDSGRTVNLVGMCRGMCTRSIIRPLHGVGGGNLVLYVARAFTPEDRAALERGEGDWVRADHFDLGRLSELTARELEVLRLISMSMSTSEIAQRLHRSVKTIEWHRVSLGSKLGASNRVELARIAQCAGLANFDDATFLRLVRSRGEVLTAQPF